MTNPEAELAIRNRYAAYCFATDDRDPAATADCFTGDAVVEVVGQSRLEGRDTIARTQETPSTNRHLTLNVWVTLRDDALAYGRAYFLILDREGGVIGHGRYRDELVCCDDGVWRFRSRAIEYAWQSDDYAGHVDKVVEHANRL